MSLAILALTPLAIACLALLLTLLQQHRNLALERALAPRLAQQAAARTAMIERTRLAPLVMRPTISALLDRFAIALPADARLWRLAVDRDGRIDAQVDCNDPELLLAALRSDAALRSLAIVGQGPAEEGLRVTLASRPS